MNYVRLIKKHFDFLKRNGFKRKVFTKNCDVEVTYTNKNLTVTVCRELCVTSSPLTSNFDIDSLIDNSAYFVWVELEYGYQGSNLLYCDLFEKDSRRQLKSDIAKADNHEQILVLYSEFIKNNLPALLKFV